MRDKTDALRRNECDPPEEQGHRPDQPDPREERANNHLTCAVSTLEDAAWKAWQGALAWRERQK